MDKYEFNIKVEQLKKLVNKSDYETAMKIADTIDWRRVRNANLLSMVAQVYERNEEYQEAKDILLLAFERAPIGKRLLFKLTELALKEGNVEEAEAYYREFCDLAPDDSQQHLLRYLILREKGAPAEQLIHSLQSYTTEELDEKWLYELASLYHQIGDGLHCVNTCDKIMLMFGLGKYVDKAMELKLQYAPLTKYQMDLVENRDMYEAKLRAVEQSYDGSMEEEPTLEPIVNLEPADRHDYVMAVKQAEVEEHLAEEMSKISFADYADEDTPAERTRILGDLRSIQMTSSVANHSAVPIQEEPKERDFATERPIAECTVTKKAGAEIDKDHDRGAAIAASECLAIQSRTPQKGLEMAVEALKELQSVTGVKNPVAKISGSKLNKKGLQASMEKLEGKDLIIEEAGDLSAETVKELNILLEKAAGTMRVILIDNPKQMEMMAANYSSLLGRFQVVGEEIELSAEKPAAPASAPVPVTEKSPEPDTRPVRHVKPERAEYQMPIKKAPVEAPVDEKADEEEMDIDEFAQYACRYAGEIDCSITGKSMLALYERIEIMEEDGILLNRSSAEELIEEAADRAEKPSIGKFITGVFSSKYDKDGLLILKEEHFI